MLGNVPTNLRVHLRAILDRRRGAGVVATRSRRNAPAVESLEGRRLLSTYTGPSAHRPLFAPAGAFVIEVSGPGAVEVRHRAGGAIDLSAFGTTSNSTITITETQPRYHAASQLLAINNLRIRSGQLGGLVAPTAMLNGKMTRLTGSINTLELGTIGPKAQVDIDGSVGTLGLSSIDIGPTGHVVIAGDVNSIAQGGGAQLPSSANGTTTTSTGNTSGTSPTEAMTIGAVTINGGRLSIGRDSLESIAISGDVTISHDGVFSIGRDQNGSFTINGSVLLSSGGQLLVGRNLGSLAITGNVIVQPSGSGVAVNGVLSSLSVNGYIQGQGGRSTPSAIDLGVGLNLAGLTVNGGVSGQGGLINANIRAGGSVSGVNIPYGTYNSTIQSNATMTT